MPCTYDPESNPSLLDELDKLTAMLCEECLHLDSLCSTHNHLFTPELKKWWISHKAADAKKAADEKRRIDEEYQRKLDKYNKLKKELGF